MASVTRDRPKGSRPPPSVRTRFVHLGKKAVTSIVAIGTPLTWQSNRNQVGRKCHTNMTTAARQRAAWRKKSKRRAHLTIEISIAGCE